MPQQQRRGHRPDPARHRAERPRDLRDRRVDVPGQPALRCSVGAHIHHDSISGNKPTSHQPRSSRCHHKHLGRRRHGREVHGPRVAHGHGRVPGEQQLRHRLAHHGRTSHHHRTPPAQRHLIMIQQRQHCRRGGRREGRQPGHQPPQRGRVRPVDVLGRVDKRRQVGQPRPARQRRLQHDAMDQRVLAQRDQLHPNALHGRVRRLGPRRRSRAQIGDVAGYADLGRRPGQRPHVPGGGLVGGGGDHRQRRGPPRRGELGGLGRGLGPDGGGQLAAGHDLAHSADLIGRPPPVPRRRSHRPVRPPGLPPPPRPRAPRPAPGP